MLKSANSSVSSKKQTKLTSEENPKLETGLKSNPTIQPSEKLFRSSEQKVSSNQNENTSREKLDFGLETKSPENTTGFNFDLNAPPKLGTDHHSFKILPLETTLSASEPIKFLRNFKSKSEALACFGITARVKDYVDNLSKKKNHANTNTNFPNVCFDISKWTTPRYYWIFQSTNISK